MSDKRYWFDDFIGEQKVRVMCSDGTWRDIPADVCFDAHYHLALKNVGDQELRDLRELLGFALTLLPEALDTELKLRQALTEQSQGASHDRSYMPRPK